METSNLEIQASVVKFNDQNVSTAKRIILDWIPAIDFGAKHSELFRQKQDGTGQWFLESNEINTWLETKGDILFCPGIPGAGKSILTAILVDQLLKRYKNSTERQHVGVAYIYFDYKAKIEWKMENLLSSLLKQLSQNLNPLPEALTSLYEEHVESKTRPSVNEVLTVLESIAGKLSRSFILVDAVDECSISENCQQQFVRQILRLRESFGTNILATARDVPDVRQLFSACRILKVCADDGDIRRFIDGRISRLPHFVQRSAELQEKIKTTVIKSAQGMFLLARLHLDSLAPEHVLTVKQAHAVLAKLPVQYDCAYHEVMERIETQSPARKELAKKTLSWIVFTKRPLTASELQEAVAVEPGDSELEEDSLPSIKDIVSVCAGLVTIDNDCGIVRLIHHTTQKFFESTKLHWFPGLEAHVARSLIAYLSFPMFENMFYDPDTGIPERDYSSRLLLTLEDEVQNESTADFTLNYQVSPLHSYAARHWVSHAGFGSLDSREVSSFLTSQAQLISGTLLWAARTGNEEIVQWLVEQGVDPNVHDATRRTPLHYAVSHHWANCIKLLLEHDATLEADIDNMSPLHWSILRGDDALIPIFLNAGISIDFGINRKIWVPVHLFGQVVYFSRPITPQTETKSHEPNGLTSLHLATLMGSRRMVELLLNYKANANAVSEHGETSLHLALKRDLHGPLQHEYPDCWNDSDYRLEAAYGALGFGPGYEDEWSEARVHVEQERFAIFRLLLNRSFAKMSMQDVYGAYPIHCVTYGWVPLAESPTQTSEPTAECAMPPELTAARCISELLQRGASISVRNNRRQTPLHLACLAGDWLAVKYLLRYGSNPADCDSDGRTALYYALQCDNVTARQLLDRMSDAKAAALVGAADMQGGNALHHIIGRKEEYVDVAMLSYLLTYGVGVNDLDNAGLSPLANYLSRKDISPDPSGRQIIKMLFEYGADPSFFCQAKGLGLAHLYATGYNVSVDVLKTLATFGVDLGRIDGDGRTLLHHLAIAGCLTAHILDYLCDVVGLSKGSKDTDGKTALCYAADKRKHHHPECFDSERWSRTEVLLRR